MRCSRVLAVNMMADIRLAARFGMLSGTFLLLGLSLLAYAGAQSTTAAPSATAAPAPPATTPVPTCPGTLLKDYIFDGATGIECDSRERYRAVIQGSVPLDRVMCQHVMLPSCRDPDPSMV